MIKRSCKGSGCIGYLKAEIDEIEIQHGNTWNDYFKLGIQIGWNYTLEDLQKKGQKLKQLKRKIPADVKFPTAIQVCLEDELSDAVDEFEENTKEALGLARLQSRLEFELILFIYLDYLRSQVMLVGDTEESKKAEDLSGPEMVKRLVEILMLNREKDKEVIEEVKAALLKWEV